MNRSKIVSFGVLGVLGILVVSSIMRGDPASGDGEPGRDQTPELQVDGNATSDAETRTGPAADERESRPPTPSPSPSVAPPPGSSEQPARDDEVEPKPPSAKMAAIPAAARDVLAAATREIDAGNVKVALPAIGEYYRKSDDRAVRDALRPKLLAWAKRHVFALSDAHGFFQKIQIQPGDSLVRIAKRVGQERGFPIDPLFVQEVNRIRDPRKIRAGSRLFVPTMAPAIVVTLAEYRLDFYLAGCLAASYRAGIGKPETETPVASYQVASKLDEPDWFFDGKRIPFGSKENELGERWIGLIHETLTGFGIHGTNDEASIGKAASRGCVRLKNSQVIELYRRVPLGTPVEIRP